MKNWCRRAGRFHELIRGCNAPTCTPVHIFRIEIEDVTQPALLSTLVSSNKSIVPMRAKHEKAIYRRTHVKEQSVLSTSLRILGEAFERAQGAQSSV